MLLRIFAIFFFRKVQKFLQSLCGTDRAIRLTGNSRRTGNRSLNLPDKLNDCRQHSIRQVSPIDSQAAPEHTKQPAQLKDQINPHINIGSEIPFFQLHLHIILLPLVRLPFHSFLRNGSLHKPQILQCFLQKRMQSSLAFLHSFMPRFHRPSECKKQEHSKCAPCDQNDHESPVH